MKPLSNLFVLAATANILNACSNKNNSIVFEGLSESLESSSMAVKKSTNEAISYIEGNKKDPMLAEKAIFWSDVAKSINIKATGLTEYIDSLSTNLNEEGHQINEISLSDLYVRLKQFRDFVLSSNTDIKRELEKKFIVYNYSFQQRFKSSEDFYKMNFEKNDNIISKAILKKISSDVYVGGNAAILMCRYMSMPGCILTYDNFQAVVVSNSTKFGIGEKIIINAGVGSFNATSKPSYTINGAKVAPNENGVAEYKMNVGNKPGKYKVRAKINYTKHDGTANSMEKDIEYTVVE